MPKLPRRFAVVLLFAVGGCRRAGVAEAVLRLNPTLGVPYSYQVDLRSRGIAGPNYKADQTIKFYAKDARGFYSDVFSAGNNFPYRMVFDDLGQVVSQGFLGEMGTRPVTSLGIALGGLSFPKDAIRVGYTWWTNAPLSKVDPTLAGLPEVFRGMPLPLKNRVTRINLKTVRIDTVASKRFFSPPPNKDILDLNLDAKTYFNEEDGMLVMSVTQISVQIYGKRTVDGHLETIITRQSSQD